MLNIWLKLAREKARCVRYKQSSRILALALLAIMVGGILGVGIAHAAYTHTLLIPWDGSYQTCTFHVQDIMGSTTKTQFASACVHWNDQLTKSFLYKSSSDTAETFPYENGIKTVTKWNYGYTEWVAQCIPYYNSSNKVKETDIELNSYHPFANSPLPDHYDVQSILTHELGHALRVGHSTVSSDTMYTPIPKGTDYARTVTAADKEAARDSTARWFN